MAEARNELYKQPTRQRFPVELSIVYMSEERTQTESKCLFLEWIASNKKKQQFLSMPDGRHKHGFLFSHLFLREKSEWDKNRPLNRIGENK